MLMKIIKKILPSHKYQIKCPYLMLPKRIVIHDTDCYKTAEEAIFDMTNSCEKNSFHYAVDAKEIIQGIPEGRNAWHIEKEEDNKGNFEGIAIKICYPKNDDNKFIAAEENAIKLIIDILNRYNWGIDKVTKHQDYNGSYCPHKILDMGWEHFINRIKLKRIKTEPRPFIIGETVYNKDNIYLCETAGYGGKETILRKNTKSVVKKFHYNKKLYMALGDDKNYYDIAWTSDLNKFITDCETENLVVIEDKEKVKKLENEDIRQITSGQNKLIKWIINCIDKIKKSIKYLIK